jgi:SOS response regulatory protein OraA/RecX
MGTVFEMLVSNEQYERFDIEEGEIIDDAHFLKIREEMLFDNARRAAFSILSCGENNKKALITKLQARGYSYELCKNMAIYMEHRGYIDEKKQIKLLCQNYLKKKYGKLKIINELVSHGYQREDVQEFVKKHFPNIEVSYAKQDNDLFERDYTVVLTNGNKIEFTSKGEWKEVDCEHHQVPEGIIPDAIRKYLNENQKGHRVIEIKKDFRHYDVKLSNKLEMEFGLDGKLLRYD